MSYCNDSNVYNRNEKLWSKIATRFSENNKKNDPNLKNKINSED